MTRFSFLTTLFLIAAPQCVLADTSLYAEAAPADASFVRFIGFDGANEAEFDGFTFALNGDVGEAYIPVSAALLKGTEPGRYVSVFRRADGEIRTITEGARASRSKVSLLMVNAGDTPVHLRLADGSVPVVEDVGPNSAAQRDVNPVAISLGVFSDSAEAPLAVFDVALHRGQNLSFVVDAGSVRLIENQFAPVAK
ncbi:alginate O-acetyltransferase AlgF [uncultured Sulfitobacter sp.]|uniref:alginate O-acetyltransferase AlgF n=1 Tax=uncultured Sulfitobacter sp. TaxID=191468 RepID=UPI00260BD58B|nr:alginate O-acetyltransferase AlgF [uncultured Sulfitobacter sp.]